MKLMSRHDLSQRWVMALMGMLGVTVAFMMRTSLSITLTQMVRPVTVPDDPAGAAARRDYCQVVPEGAAAVESDRSGEKLPPTGRAADRFDWDERTQGAVLFAFYYGYVLTHLPGGELSQRFGGKHTMGFGILSAAVCTLATPYVARLGSTQLIALRFVEGLGEGMMFPALCTLLSLWAPSEEKGKLSTTVFTGVQIGIILANCLSGFIIRFIPGGWPCVFYFFGTISLVWFVAWCMFVYNDPNSHPFILDEEREYLARTIGRLERKKDLSPTPWKSILTSWSVWALVVAEIGHDWGVLTIVTDLPKYMSDVLHFSIAENGFLSALPFFALWVTSMVASVIADRLIAKRALSTTAVRKIFAVIGNVGPGLGVMCASFVGCNKILATLCFTVGMALVGFCYPSICINSLDLSPNYAPTIMALVNCIGCLSGLVTPYVAGILTPNRTVLEWRLVFWTMMIIMTGSSVIFGLFGSGQVQPWDGMEQDDLKEEAKERRRIQYSQNQ